MFYNYNLSQFFHLVNTTIAQSSSKKKASLWVQITLTQFQFVLRNGETVHSSDITNQLILDIEDIVSSVDVQSVYMKVNLKIGALSLRCYERYELIILYSQGEKILIKSYPKIGKIKENGILETAWV